FSLSACSLFLSPAINFFALESQEVTHTRVWQWMPILGALGPLHDSCGCRLALRIYELPVTSKLGSGHPVRGWIDGFRFVFVLRKNQSKKFMSCSIKGKRHFLFEIIVHCKYPLCSAYCQLH